MTQQQNNSLPVARIDYLRVKNYRVLHDLELGPLTTFSVFIGPNGSGKSTLFDVLAFLCESFSEGLHKAWSRRGGFQELRTRGESGPITIEFTYREHRNSSPLTYHLTFNENEEESRPIIIEEWLAQKGESGQMECLLDFSKGKGSLHKQNNGSVQEVLNSPDILAANVFGQLASYPRISTLRDFVTGWHISLLSMGQPGEISPNRAARRAQEQLSATGHNLAHVVRYFEEQHPERLKEVMMSLSRFVPELERIETVRMWDGQLQLQLKDTSFKKPIPSRLVSDGTIQLLAQLILLNEPTQPPLIALEEPENHIHPRLLPELAEECRKATGHTQLLVATHSPFFVNSLRPEEMWVLYRNAKGFTQARRTVDIRGIKSFMQYGALLGNLWTEGYFVVGDPLKQNSKQLATR